MKQILWFRRDLRITDNAILANANKEVLAIFIFDKKILSSFEKYDKRINFLYKSVLEFKKKLKTIGLDLAIFFDEPINVFKSLKKDFDEVLCSIEFDSYSRKLYKEIENLIPLKKYIDSFILNPKEHLKKDGTSYKVFTPFFKSLSFLVNSHKIETYKYKKNLIKLDFDYDKILNLETMGFEKVVLEKFLYKDISFHLKEFESKIKNYHKNRDFFYKDATSNFSIFLRYGLISPKELFNYYKKFENSDVFIRQLFWREFYNYILFHNPKSEFENFNNIKIPCNENEEHFIAWCEGNTGIAIIDAAMRYLNKTGLMHNRLRMVVSSFLTKNLFIDWRKGESYFAKKLLDYEVSSNVGSWQWSASTGADASPYFRVFNPYVQSKKFDKEAIFIKSVFKEFKDVDSKLFHIENALYENSSINYKKAIVNIKNSRKEAIEKFKRAKSENL